MGQLILKPFPIDHGSFRAYFFPTLFCIRGRLTMQRRRCQLKEAAEACEHVGSVQHSCRWPFFVLPRRIQAGVALNEANDLFQMAQVQVHGFMNDTLSDANCMHVADWRQGYEDHPCKSRLAVALIITRVWNIEDEEPLDQPKHFSSKRWHELNYMLSGSDGVVFLKVARTCRQAPAGEIGPNLHRKISQAVREALRQGGFLAESPRLRQEPRLSPMPAVTAAERCRPEYICHQR